jgi:Mg2+ and Co2+ transporter CorA
MSTRQDELRRFAALRRRLNALQQDAYTTARVLENTDWRSGNQGAEFAALTSRSIAIDDEVADIEYLLDYYERTMANTQTMILTPQTVLVIAAVITTLFTAMTLAAGLLAGTFRVG